MSGLFIRYLAFVLLLSFGGVTLLYVLHTTQQKVKHSFHSLQSNVHANHPVDTCHREEIIFCCQLVAAVIAECIAIGLVLFIEHIVHLQNNISVFYPSFTD